MILYVKLTFLFLIPQLILHITLDFILDAIFILTLLLK